METLFQDTERPPTEHVGRVEATLPPCANGTRRSARAVFWILLAAFVVLASGWCVYFPYDPRLLFYAVPSEASWISRHRHLAERWDMLVRNPVLRHVACVLSGARDIEEKLNNDQTISAWIRHYAGRDVVTARVRDFSPTAVDTWMFASWAGARAQWFRFLANVGLIGPREKVPLGGGRQGWRFPVDAGEKAFLSVATVGGVILGCVSEDPSGVRRLVARLERRVQPPAPLRRWLEDVPRAVPEDVSSEATRDVRTKEVHQSPDWGWMRVGDGITDFEWTLRACTLNGLAGTVVGAASPPLLVGQRGWDAEQTRRSDSKEMAAALGDAPAVLAVVPWETLESLLNGPGRPPEWTRLLARVHSAIAENAPVCVMLATRAYDGRLLGIRAPTFLLALKLRVPEKATDLLADTVELLNGAYGFRLVAQPPQVGEQDVTVIATLRKEGYGRLAPAEQVAVTRRGSWLFVASNQEGLRQVMTLWKRAPKEEKWAVDLSKASGTHWLWLDVREAKTMTATLLAVVDLLRLAGLEIVKEKERGMLAAFRDWLHALQPLESCWIDFSRRGAGFSADFLAGRVP